MADPSSAWLPKSSFPGLIWPAIPDSSGAIALSLLAQLEESQWWSANLLRRQQNLQLTALLQFAVTHVPFYQQRFQDFPNDHIDTEWFSQQPLLTRSELQRCYQELAASNPPDSHGNVNVAKSSGSTGSPVRVNQTEMFMLFEAAALLRQHHWHRRDFSRHLAVINQHGNKLGNFPAGYTQTSWGWPVDSAFYSGQLSLLGIRETIPNQLEWLGRVKPDYLLTTPSNLRALVEYCQDHSIILSAISSVSTTMEVVDESLRTLVRNVWDTPVIDQYSCREVGSIAHQCPDHDHYHVNAENVLVEILDENGNPCSPGQVGRVVITGLQNFAMPLIRYELADYAEVGEPCSCGRGLMVLNRIMGRVRNLVRLPNGEKRWPRLGRPAIRDIIPVLSYRFSQTTIDTLEMRLGVERPVTPAEERALTAHFHSKLPYPFKIVYQYVDALPISEGGKQEDFICEID